MSGSARQTAPDIRGQAELRPLRPEDLDAALDLWVASWQAAYPAIDFAARRHWMAERLAEQRREGAACLVALAEGRIVGLLLLNPRTGYLDQIAVAPERQGGGVADLLMTEAKRLCPAGLALHVNQDNARAIRFYRRHGLHVVEEDVNPRSGAPTYRMRWKA